MLLIMLRCIFYCCRWQQYRRALLPVPWTLVTEKQRAHAFSTDGRWGRRGFASYLSLIIGVRPVCGPFPPTFRQYKLRPNNHLLGAFELLFWLLHTKIVHFHCSFVQNGLVNRKIWLHAVFHDIRTVRSDK